MLVSRMEVRSVAAVSRAVSKVSLDRFGSFDRTFEIRGPSVAMSGYILSFRGVWARAKEASIRIC